MASLPIQIACVRREIAQRRNVYPRLIRDQKMTQDMADHEIATMEAVLATLIDLHGEPAMEQQDLFRDA